jgi:hypothetical protein
MRSLREGRYGCALALVAAFSLAPVPAGAEDGRVLVQDSPLAGFSHDQAAAVFAELRIGDGLRLARERDNPHDVNAVRVEWQGHKLGYVPRARNAELASAMDRGETVSARVTRLRHHPDPRRRIQFDVYLGELR